MADGAPVSDDPLDPQDRTLVTLARAARARTGGAEGAAVRDDIGRTYAAGTVGLASLQLTALQAAVAAALSSGADRLVAVVVHSAASGLSPADAAVVGELGPPTVLLAGPDLAVTAVT